MLIFIGIDHMYLKADIKICFVFMSLMLFGIFSHNLAPSIFKPFRPNLVVLTLLTYKFPCLAYLVLWQCNSETRLNLITSCAGPITLMH